MKRAICSCPIYNKAQDYARDFRLEYLRFLLDYFKDVLIFRIYYWGYGNNLFTLPVTKATLRPDRI